MAAKVEITTAQKVADQEIEEKLGHTAILEAKQATEEEHAQTLWQALNENRKAVMWSFLISMAIIMEGYVYHGRI
jgi:MFS transporter, SP family, general alpha glucoside:H+ symporter